MGKLWDFLMRRKPLCLTFLLIFAASVVLSNRFLAERIALLPQFTGTVTNDPVETPTSDPAETVIPAETTTPAEPSVDGPDSAPATLSTDDPATPPELSLDNPAATLDEPITEPAEETPADPPVTGPITTPIEPADPAASPDSTPIEPADPATTPIDPADPTATSTEPDVATTFVAAEDYFILVASPRDVIAMLTTIDVPRTGGELPDFGRVATSNDGLGVGSNLLSDASQASDPVSIAISTSTLASPDLAGNLWLNLLTTLASFLALLGLFSLAAHFLR